MKGLLVSFLLFIACAMQLGCSSNAKEPEALATPPPTLLKFDATQSDSSAILLADKIISAVGGKEQLDAVQYLAFHFIIKADSGLVSDWRHDWDRRQQRYRLAGTLASGEQVLVFLNLNSQDGQAFLNGTPAPEEEVQALLAMAYSRFIADTYWLLLPFKLKDPGARLQNRGVTQLGAASFAVLHLSFANGVGLTPENSYTIFIDPQTYEIRRWEYFQQSEAKPLIAWWENWQSFGALKLATQRRLEESGRTIVFEGIAVSSVVDESLFIPPATLQSGMQ